MRWPTCCVPGCGKPSQAVYRRRERGPDGKLRSQKSRGLCGEHDNLLRNYWNQLFLLISLDDPQTLHDIQFPDIEVL